MPQSRPQLPELPSLVELSIPDREASFQNRQAIRAGLFDNAGSSKANTMLSNSSDEVEDAGKRDTGSRSSGKASRF